MPVTSASSAAKAGQRRALSRLSASSGRSWASASATGASIPAAAHDAPAPSAPRSSTATSRPRWRARQAAARPMTPPPTTATSTCGSSVVTPSEVNALPHWDPMDLTQRRERLAHARLYLVSGDRPGGRPLAEVLGAALRGGVDVFQLRMKDAGDAAILAAAAVARDACTAAGALFVLNDRPDLVAAAGADGVHVGRDDVPVAQARALAGPQALVGVSTHTPAQVDGAGAADYIGVGPV